MQINRLLRDATQVVSRSLGRFAAGYRGHSRDATTGLVKASGDLSVQEVKGAGRFGRLLVGMPETRRQQIVTTTAIALTATNLREPEGHPLPPVWIPDTVTYKIGPPERPEPRKDDTFIPNTVPPERGDHAKLLAWRALLSGAELLRPDLDDATAAYRRYLDNSGEPFEVDYDEAYREDSGVRHSVDDEMIRAASAADRIVRQGNRNFQMTGSVAGTGTSTENWQRTLGGYQQWSHSRVTVDGSRVTMEITVEALDYYNFNRGSTDIATGIPDTKNGRFAEVGLARPFETHGSLVRVLTWEVGQPPEGATVVEISAPQRNPGREDRVDDRDPDNHTLDPKERVEPE